MFSTNCQHWRLCSSTEGFRRTLSWSNYWKLDFNSSRCKVVSFIRNRNLKTFFYKINGEPLEHVSSFCALCVTINCLLTHNVHINNSINKCNKVNGMIGGAVNYKAPASVTLNLYKVLIRPIAQYSSPLWSPFFKSHIESVVRIQRNFTRYAMHYPSLNYKERCEIMQGRIQGGRLEVYPPPFEKNINLFRGFLVNWLHTMGRTVSNMP